LRRRFFAEVDNFLLYDFVADDGSVDMKYFTRAVTSPCAGNWKVFARIS
jgi:hypothetical protein